MRIAQSPHLGWLAGLALALAYILSATTAHANVYATDIRLNGALNNAKVLLPGDSLTISYILNDTATGGVWVRIYSGTNLIKTLASTNGKAGTNAGLNSAVWSNPLDLAQGAYTVSITAASAGYATWTNITDDGPNFSAKMPSGVAVNQNTNSPFYGRVYVADDLLTENDSPGIFKCNADGSPADEGGFSTGGYGWAGNLGSPWHMAIGADDRLYVDDFTGQGIVLSFDPTIDDNSLAQVIRTDNYPVSDPSASLSGLSVIGAGANTQIWMTDAPLSGESAGIIGWQIGADGVAATNDPGTVIVPLDWNFLTDKPYDLAVDSNGFIYTIQYLTPYDGPAYALMSFPPYEEEPESTAHWAVEMYPTLLEAYGVAVDPTASFVAVAVVGTNGVEYDTIGGLYLFRAINGEFITEVDSGGHGYYGVAWDNVGNLYASDGTALVWRAYSPPGANQATTAAVPVIQVYNALLVPGLVNPTAVDPSILSFTLEGQSNVTYVIQYSTDLINWADAATNFSANAMRNICVPAGGNQNFYRAMTVP